MTEFRELTLIVGEGLFGVAFAGIVAATGSDSPLAVVGADFEPIALWGGLAVFTGLVWWVYRYTRRASR